MYTCPKCQAVYFIDIAGQPEFGDMTLSIPEQPLSIDENPVIADYYTAEEPNQVSEFSKTALEITDFANQDNTISALTYDLKISGLDTKETMLLFREAVTDLKFGWIAQEIFATVKDGTCQFKDLNPLQAYVLAKRIQFLDLDMEWKQNVQS